MMKLLVPAVTLAAASAFADFSADTIGFYPFTDGETGTSAAQLTLVNAANPGAFDATGIKYDHANTYAKGIIDFDADAPGKYIFADNRKRFPEPICTDPQSLDLSVKNDREENYNFSGGFVSFDGILSEIAQKGEGTIEFFWKIPTGQKGVVTYGASCIVDFGLKNASGDARKLSLALPLAMGSATYGMRVSLFESAGAWDSAYYADLITYDEWHHIAISFSGDKVVLTCDYKYTLTRTGYTSQELAESLPFVFGKNEGGYSGFHGKVACFRFSNKALEADDFLRASDNPRFNVLPREPEALGFDEDTLAFYSLKEGIGHAGESFLGQDVLNDIDINRFYGLAKTSGELTYDDDVPGRYLFTACVPGATCCCSNPMSVAFNKGQINLTSVAEELWKLPKSTIEFFWKLPTDGTEAGYSSFLRFFDIINPGGVADSIELYIPVANHLSDPSRGKEVRMASGLNISSYTIPYSYPDGFPGGIWHHMAIVYDEGTVRLYLDYKLRASLSGYARAATCGTKTLTLDYNGAFKGKMSCFRFSKKALQPSEMVYASSSPDCCSPEIFRFQYENSTVGSVVSVVTNTAPTYAGINPGIYLVSDESSGRVSGGGNHLPTYDAAKWWTQVRARADAEPEENARSIHFVTTPKASADALFATGPSVRFSSAPDGPMTTEAFVKFDYRAYMEHIGNVYSESRHRVNLIGMERSGGNYAWRLYAQNCHATSPYLELDVTCTDGTTKSFLLSNNPMGVGFRNRWHHFAVVYDEANLNVKVYYDYKKVIDETLPAPIDISMPGSDLPYFQFGAGGNNQPFDGWMDEMRLTGAVLTPDGFLHPDGRPGMMLMVR